MTTTRDLQIALARFNGANERARREYDTHPFTTSCPGPGHDCAWQKTAAAAKALRHRERQKEKRAS